MNWFLLGNAMLRTPGEKGQLRALRATVLVATIFLAVAGLDSAAEEDYRTALFAAATAAYRGCQTSKPLAPSDAICLSGKTNDTMRAAFNEGLKPTTKFVVIESAGGPVTPAMDIAFQMMERGIDVIVANKCHSSCANYIFLAAPHKFIINDAIVGWHGSPASMPRKIVSTQSQQGRGNVDHEIARNNQFFAILRTQGVRQDLVDVRPPDLKPGSPFWTYSEKQLEEEFGVRNVFRLSVDAEADK